MSISLPMETLKRHMNEVFIETGSNDCRGAILAWLCGFHEIHTIEIDEVRLREARKRASVFPEIKLYEGDSVLVLPEILKSMPRRATIFLDAHPVGENDACRKGLVQWPLITELKMIADLSSRKDHTILVDDRHEFELFGTTDDEIAALFMEINPSYEVSFDGNPWNGKGDIMVAKIP